MSIPPLYSALTLTRKGDVPAALSMAHVAAAALTIVLDLARLVDTQQLELDSDDFALQVKTVASSCASILEAAAKESKDLDTNNNVMIETTNGHAHGKILIEAILTLSSLMDQASTIQSANSSSWTTIPQQLANALLPTYFPQSHIFTFMACTLPGLCNTFASNKTASTSLVGEVAQTILNSGSIGNYPVKPESSLAALSSWATNITQKAGIPTMARLAFGTPDLHGLFDKLDAYDALMESQYDGIGGRRSNDHMFLLQDVLERSLNR
eukprot:CCRYP_000793-RA/>CCRYP_000793-RA protein AED:0.43 eAED:0.43 QI:0/-1/0/1/-1/1/1/0/267